MEKGMLMLLTIMMMMVTCVLSVGIVVDCHMVAFCLMSGVDLAV